MVNKRSTTTLAMSMCNPLSSRVSIIFLVYYLFLCLSPGLTSSAVVTLGSIEIYNTHELFKIVKPSVYFRCKGENKTELPDVKKKHQVYNFKGEESWQPLTELLDKKCKRCGFYEADTFKPDHIFDEWELCPDDFEAPNGKYIRLKQEEFNVTFLCPECIKKVDPSSTPIIKSKPVFSSKPKRKELSVSVIIFITALVSSVFVIVAVVAYNYWQKKRRGQGHAKLRKAF